jgi:hypothetical protein
MTENFSEDLLIGHYSTIMKENKFYTACEDSKIPFIGADDISAVSFRALTDEKSHNTGHYILGPELLTNDEVSIYQTILYTKEKKKKKKENKNLMKAFFPLTTISRLRKNSPERLGERSYMSRLARSKESNSPWRMAYRNSMPN